VIWCVYWTEEDANVSGFGVMMLGCDRFEVKEAVMGDVSCNCRKEYGRCCGGGEGRGVGRVGCEVERSRSLVRERRRTANEVQIQRPPRLYPLNQTCLYRDPWGSFERLNTRSVAPTKEKCFGKEKY